MKKVFENEYYSGRTPEQQQIIELLSDYFPESGYPRQIIWNKDFIVIASSLVDLSIGVKHHDYENKVNIPAYRICIYRSHDLKTLNVFDIEFPSNSIVIENNIIFIGAGFYGDSPKGKLMAINMDSPELLTCSDLSRPIGLIKKINSGTLEVYTYKSTGYHEGQNEILKFSITGDLYLDYKNSNNVRVLDESELELIEDSEPNTVTLDNLKEIIDSERTKTKPI